MIEPVLLQRMQTRPVVVLTGARQTGKTALVRRLFPQHAYVSLDLPSEAEQAERGAFAISSDSCERLRCVPPGC